jgi:hypothetical protein
MYKLSVATCTAVILSMAANGAEGDGPTPNTGAPGSAGAAADIPFVTQSPADLLPEWLQIHAQIRGRFEATSGTSLTNGTPGNDYLSRIRLSLGVKPTSWLRFFVQSQDARVVGYQVSPAPNTVYNPIDLRQGYIELGGESTQGVSVRVGRQELAFGGERLIGPADWGMSRTFDAVDLSVVRGKASLDLFGGSSVLIDPNRFDRHKPGEHFYGAYGSIKNLGLWLNIEPYVLFKQTLLVKSENGLLGDALVTSPGVRVLGKVPGNVDYIAEVVVQRGSYSADRVAADGQSYVLGWTVSEAALKPRLSAEYSYASGDKTVKDGSRNTFDQFYPSNHGYYGMFDQFGWKNLKNVRTGFDCQASKKLKFRADFNEFYLASVQDGLYNSSGTSVVLNRKASSSHIGSSVGATAMYQWTKVWKFGAGYSQLFVGDFLKESNTTFGYRYPYVTFVGSF